MTTLVKNKTGEHTSLLPIIKQRPIPIEPITICPLCEGGNVRLIESMGTLVGFSGDDPNHYTHLYRCTNCDNRFVVNQKLYNMWITKVDGHVIQGVSNCFEKVIYTCATCGGDVVKTHLDLNGKVMGDNEGLSWSDQGPNFITKWGCVSCSSAVEKRGSFEK